MLTFRMYLPMAAFPTVFVIDARSVAHALAQVRAFLATAPWALAPPTSRARASGQAAVTVVHDLRKLPSTPPLCPVDDDAPPPTERQTAILV